MQSVVDTSLPVEALGVYSPEMTRRTAPRRPLNNTAATSEKSDTVAVPRWIISWLIPAVSALLLGLVVWYYNTHIPLQVANQLVPTNDRLTRVESKFDAFENKLDLILKMTSIAKGPTASNLQDYQNDLNDTKSLLATAKEKGVILDPDTVGRVGRLVLERDTDKPELQPVAWDTAVRFADYRTYIVAALKPSGDGYSTAPSSPIQYPPGSMVRVSGTTYNSTTIVLDWGDWDNIMFRNCLIKYEGGPVNLNKVQFENCQFLVNYEIKGKKLLDSILASNASTLDLT